MRESVVEGRLRREVCRRGGIAFKLVSPGNDGISDRLVVLPGNRIYFVELKQAGEKARPRQKRQHDRLRKRGCLVFTLAGKEEVDDWLAWVDEQMGQKGGKADGV